MTIVDDARTKHGIEEFKLMLACYVNSNNNSDFKIDERGRVTHKDDTPDRVESTSLLRGLFIFSIQGDVDLLCFMFGQFTCQDDDYIAEGTVDKQLADCHKKSGIDIPLYKIIASLYLRYCGDYTLPNVSEHNITHCSHTSKINLRKYAGVVDFEILTQYAIVMAYPKEYDLKMKDHEEYSVSCGLTAFPKLRVF